MGSRCGCRAWWCRRRCTAGQKLTKESWGALVNFCPAVHRRLHHHTRHPHRLPIYDENDRESA
eukprot:4958264-Pyramimonas_sp.AAC.1